LQTASTQASTDSRLFLAHRCALDGVRVRRNVYHLEGDDIATAQLAIDNIAKSRLRSAIWSFLRIDQTCFGRSGGLAPTSLPLFQGPTEASLFCMVILLVSENGQHGLSASVPGRRLASAI
jgi:hypothetical protein